MIKRNLSLAVLISLLSVNTFCMEADLNQRLMQVSGQMDNKVWKTLDLEIKREKTLIPQGKVEEEKAWLNLVEDDPITQESFRELIEQQESKRPFILATLETKPQDTRTYRFYSAPELNTHLFGESFSEDRYEIGFKHFKDPINNQEIVGSIYYFVIKSLSDAFKYLGSDYDIFRGTEEKKKFLHTYFMAAQGDQVVLNSLGCMYQNGLGVDKDLQEAVRLYRLAADPGNNASAQYNLAYMYQHGLGVEQDYKEAAKFYRLAVDQGYASAQNNLGWMYQHGFGVEKDYNEAARLYSLAVDQGNEIARANLERLQQLIRKED